jgi:CRISPR/Cas system-associated exonuclease Cas4 (RecB family)
MSLPPDFQFSQGSLQDYVDCPRRFQLRYVQRVAWPALEAMPVLEHERYLQQGATFHRLVHQHLVGLPARRLWRMVDDDDLRRWWRNYLEARPTDLPSARYPEVLLSAPVGDYRLVAKYDLVAVDLGERAVIVDWKTSRRRPKREWLAERLQTKVYPYLLVRAGAHLNGDRPLQPTQVEMVYWFADTPADPERFSYDAAHYEADEEHLTKLIEEIANLGDDRWHLTSQEQHCRFCRYRSLCQRGITAGQFDEAGDDLEPGDDFDFDLDFEQVAEIEY